MPCLKEFCTIFGMFSVFILRPPSSFSFSSLLCCAGTGQVRLTDSQAQLSWNTLCLLHLSHCSLCKEASLKPQPHLINAFGIISLLVESGRILDSFKRVTCLLILECFACLLWWCSLHVKLPWGEIKLEIQHLDHLSLAVEVYIRSLLSWLV